MGVHNAMNKPTSDQIHEEFTAGKPKLQAVIETVDFNDFQTKACLMALGSSLMSGDKDRFIADLDKVSPELREAIILATKLLYGFTAELLECIDPRWCDAENWPDEI